MADFLRWSSIPATCIVSLVAGLWTLGWTAQAGGVLFICILLSLGTVAIAALFAERAILIIMCLLSAACAAGLMRHVLETPWHLGALLGGILPWSLMLGFAGTRELILRRDRPKCPPDTDTARLRRQEED